MALEDWNTLRCKALDEIEQAHRAVEGTGRGRRYATLQVNHAFAVLLSSQFQGFCRDLHSEAVEFVVARTSPPAVAKALRAVLMQGRKLDSGNPNPGNIGSDFGRLGMDFWIRLGHVDARVKQRQASLDQLNAWRNAVAHQDWSRLPGQRPDLRLSVVQGWRSTCRGLARSFDEAVRIYLGTMVGRSPW
jgi:hypothetical protein